MDHSGSGHSCISVPTCGDQKNVHTGTAYFDPISISWERVQQKATKCLLNMPLQHSLKYIKAFKGHVNMPLKCPLKCLSIKRTYQWHVHVVSQFSVSCTNMALQCLPNYNNWEAFKPSHALCNGHNKSWLKQHMFSQWYKDHSIKLFSPPFKSSTVERYELCTELFMLSSLPYFPAFLLICYPYISLHKIF